MKRLCCWILLLAVPLVLTSCGSSKQLLADKDRQIAEKDEVIAGLRAQVDELEAEKNRASDLEAELKQALADLEKERKLRVEGNKIVMQEVVLFASGSVRITQNGKKVLDEVWNSLSKYPDRDILIEGHTDDVPIAMKYRGKYKSNWELSCARALAVLHYLRDTKDVKPTRVSAVGYGEFRPVADNSTDAGRKQNRRVVIVVGPKK